MAFSYSWSRVCSVESVRIISCPTSICSKVNRFNHWTILPSNVGVSRVKCSSTVIVSIVCRDQTARYMTDAVLRERVLIDVYLKNKHPIIQSFHTFDILNNNIFLCLVFVCLAVGCCVYLSGWIAHREESLLVNNDQSFSELFKSNYLQLSSCQDWWLAVSSLDRLTDTRASDRAERDRLPMLLWLRQWTLMPPPISILQLEYLRFNRDQTSRREEKKRRSHV